MMVTKKRLTQKREDPTKDHERMKQATKNLTIHLRKRVLERNLVPLLIPGLTAKSQKAMKASKESPTQKPEDPIKGQENMILEPRRLSTKKMLEEIRDLIPDLTTEIQKTMKVLRENQRPSSAALTKVKSDTILETKNLSTH